MGDLLEGMSASSASASDSGVLSITFVSTTRRIFYLVEVMTSDIQNVVLANLSEADLSDLVAAEAQRREIGLVMRLYGGRGGMIQSWSEWMRRQTGEISGDEVQGTWKSILIGSLGRPASIEIVPPPTTELPPNEGALADTPESHPTGSSSSQRNILPAPFLISSHNLFRIQNLLQALAITACLRLIVQPTTTTSQPASSSSQSLSNDLEALTARMWILLTAEVDRGGHAAPETKLVNLEDELWQFLQQRNASSTSSRSSMDEANLRTTVQRIVRAEDPVFALYMRRLVSTLQEWIAGPISRPKDNSTSIPAEIRSGRRMRGVYQDASRSGSRPKGENKSKAPLPTVKGFEGIILSKAVREVVDEIDEVVEWVEETWGDILKLAT